MALREYRCAKCRQSFYAFPEEKEKIETLSAKSCSKGTHALELQEPRARCVHSTEIFMLSQLDSVYTVHELNSQLMKEAADERELTEQNRARKEI